MNERPTTVYLAGGFRSGWQRQVHERLNRQTVLDPSLHGLGPPEDYTSWDLEAIRSSDCVLAYMEASNPAGYSLAMEVGFAYALGKHIVLVEEHPTSERHRYFAMIRHVAHAKFANLEDAVAYVGGL